MRGKIARALRKELKYHPRNHREYQEVEFRVVRKIIAFDKDKNIKLVDREVSSFTNECVSGDRKVYQYLKKKYNNPELEVTLTKIPKLEELQAQILKEMREEKENNTTKEPSTTEGSI